MSKSANDLIAKAIAPVMRRIQDVHMKIVGTETSILRVTTTLVDRLGQIEESLEATVIDNVIIQYPTGDIRMHVSVDSGNGIVNTDSFDLWDILPIKLIVPFEAKPDVDEMEADYTDSAIAIKEGDIIVHCFFDEQENKFPIIMQANTILGSFKTRYLIKRTYKLNLYRGILEDDMQATVDNYINNLTI